MATLNFRQTSEVKAANCLASDTVGDLVYVTGPKVSGRVQVTKVDVDDPAKMPAYAIVVSKQSATDCLVQLEGDVSESGLTPNALYFVGINSRIFEGPPPRPASGYRRYQVVGQADDTGNLYFQPEKSYTKVTT
jgi:hypothetical protein